MQKLLAIHNPNSQSMEKQLFIFLYFFLLDSLEICNIIEIIQHKISSSAFKLNSTAVATSIRRFI